MSTVFFTTARATRWDYRHSLTGRLERMLAGSGLMQRFDKNEWVAVKTHFGSDGAHRIVRPVFVRKVVEAVRAAGAKPFVTDTVRIMGLDYLEVANQNGINHLSVGAPVVLADGLYGKDSLLVKAGDILGEIAVASVIHDAPAMVVCSHVKGHIQAGYAGAIKNLAMGGVSSAHREFGWKKGRGRMHCHAEDVQLTWNVELCTFCYQCENVCPKGAISFREEKLAWDEQMCWRCGRCARVCPEGGLVLPADDETFQKSMAESAGAVLSTFGPGKVVYVNFMTEIQPECDCMPACDTPMLQDQGIMLSDDLVAIEQATLDMLRKADPLPQSIAEERECRPGDDVLAMANPRNFMLQVEHAERLGLGSREYEVVEV